MTDPIFRLMYRSRSTIPADAHRAELGSLFSTARSNNKKRGICGALLLFEDTFVQVLEGDESAVRKLYARISHDPRHEAVTVLHSGPVDDAVFARWAMAEVNPSGGADTALIAHEDGISPAAGHRTTPAQEFVLDTMRTAAREAHAV